MSDRTGWVARVARQRIARCNGVSRVLRVECLEFRVEVFGYALKQQMHAAIDMVAVEMATFHPDEREQQGCLRVVVELIEKDVLMVAIGFAQLPLHTVAVDGMMEVPFRNADEDTHRWLVGQALRG